MAEKFYHTRRLPAATAIKTFLEASVEIYKKQTIQAFRVTTEAESASYNRSNLPDIKTVTEDPSYTKIIDFLVENEFINISRIFVKSDKHSGIELTSNPTELGLKIRFMSPDGNARKELDGNAEFMNSALSVLHRKFKLRPELEIRREMFSDAESKSLAIRENQIVDLENIVNKLVSNIGNQTEHWNSVLSDKLSSLEERYTEKETTLTSQIAKKQEALETERAEFLKIKKEFDDRENRVVRRDLLKDIRKLIEEQKTFNLSEETQTKRKVVNNLCLAGLGFSSMLVFSFVLRIIFKGFDWHSWIPIASGTAIFVSTFIYLVRWNSQWYREHADAEGYNRKFAADILRASWIAELFFEWKEKKEFDFPADLMKSLSANLFVSNGSSGTINHPIEEIINSVGKVSKLRIGKGSFEVEAKETNPTKEKKRKDDE